MTLTVTFFKILNGNLFFDRCSTFSSDMSFFNRSLAGPGFIILNTIRVMNIIALLAVIAASWVMLVKTFVVSKYVTKILRLPSH